MPEAPGFIVVMGVSGSGKSTLAMALAAALGWHCYDADSYHSQANIEKMHAGQALTDADRQPWLDALAGLISGCLERHEGAVLACSALKESYRRHLGIDEIRVKLVYLKGSREEIRARLARRQGHFMNPALLDSQFEALEEPSDAVILEFGPDIATQVRLIEGAFFKKG